MSLLWTIKCLYTVNLTVFRLLHNHTIMASASFIITLLSVSLVHSNPFPPGHLQPLGLQKPADGPVDEYQGFVEPPVFQAEYIRHSRPVVFRGGAMEIPAYTSWTDEFLLYVYVIFSCVYLRLDFMSSLYGDHIYIYIYILLL